MLVNSGTVIKFIKKLSVISCLFFIVFTIKAQAQPPGGDPSNPTGLPSLPPTTTMSPAQLNQILAADKSAAGSSIGSDKNKALNNRIDRDSLVREATPQSANVTEQTYGMQLFRGGVVASVTDLSTPPLDYPIGVYDKIIVSLWNGAEATFDYNVARDGSIFPTGLGKIYLQGLTFEQVRSLITQHLLKLYGAALTIL